ncbi:hypothetical protein B0H10DRAFT_1777418, partial [Mycena sp. CBHHK59/15]
WVAKHFFDVGAGEGQVDIQENHNEIVKEATRLAKAAYFLKRFMAETKKENVDVVTDFKLAVEVVHDDSGPSTASGFSLAQYQAANDPAIVVWLFEPCRSSTVKHWSGTNDYPAWHQSKLGNTLGAFTHWAYLFSQESIVLADLQSVLYLFPSVCSNSIP